MTIAESIAPAAVPAAESHWATEPFIMGSAEQFARLRGWLTSVGYTESALFAAAGIRTLAKLPSLDGKRTAFARPDTAQSTLVLLFLDGEAFPWPVVEAAMGADGMEALSDLGLLQPSVRDASRCVGTVCLFPLEQIYVVSDRLHRAEVTGERTPSDLVYSPLTRETREFVWLMPRVPCADYLELCAGSGVAALLAAKDFAGHAWAADITERSTRFARFNAALNGLENFTAVQGDLYDAVAGRTFDIISAHPPYVPAPETEMVFRDGGADGEQITRRILAGAADHLRPGGLLYLDCALTDRTTEPLERRIRRMLGPAEDDFDVVVVRGASVAVQDYLAGSLAHGRITPVAFLQEREFFTRMGINNLTSTTTLIRRRPSPGPVVTRHHALSPRTRGEDILWLLEQSTRSVAWEAQDVRQLLDAHPRSVPGLMVHAISELREGQWARTGLAIQVAAPFAAELRCPEWFPMLLERCDGRHTGRELLEWLRSAGQVGPAMTDDDFADLLHTLSDAPFLDFIEYPAPPPAREMSPHFA